MGSGLQRLGALSDSYTISPKTIVHQWWELKSRFGEGFLSHRICYRAHYPFAWSLFTHLIAPTDEVGFHSNFLRFRGNWNIGNLLFVRDFFRIYVQPNLRAYRFEIKRSTSEFSRVVYPRQLHTRNSHPNKPPRVGVFRFHSSLRGWQRIAPNTENWEKTQ